MTDVSPRFYLTLSIASGAAAIVPAVAFFAEYGADWDRFFGPLRHNSWALILVIDLVICTIMFLVWSARDAKRNNVKGWPIALLATMFVALSCGAPLYLYLRSRSQAGALGH